MSGRYNRSAPSVAKSSNNCFTYSLQDTLLMHAHAVIFIYFLFLQKEVRLHFDLLNSLKGKREAERCKRACWCRVRRELESQLEEIDAGGKVRRSDIMLSDGWTAVRSDSPVDRSHLFGIGNIVAAHVATYILMKQVINQ